MKKIIFYLILVLVAASGCKSLRTVFNTKEKEKTRENTHLDITEKENSNSNKITVERVSGGNINARIIPEDERPRDESGALKEFKQILKDGGLTKTIIYKPDGSVDVECEHEGRYLTIIENQQHQAEKNTQLMRELANMIKAKDKDTVSQKETKGININVIVIIVCVSLLLALIIWKKL